MPFLPLNKISALAPNRQVYLRGVGGYNAGWVTGLEERVTPFYPAYLTATATEGGAPYHVEVGFDAAGEPEYLECSCPHFHPGEGACKHVVAVLVHKYYRDMIADLPTAGELLTRAQTVPATDPAAQRLIDRYMSAADTLPAPAGEPVTLTPTLSLATGRPVLTFTVGHTRGYVIKNLTRFGESMNTGETVTYGKHLTLRHHPDSFAEESRPLLTFLMGELCGRAPVSGTGVAAGELALTRAGIDRFFALYEGRTVLLRGAQERPVRLQAGDPTLPVTVQRQGTGIRFCAEETPFVAGIHGLYVLWEDTLWRTGAAYARRMTEWLRTVPGAPQGLTVAPSSLSSFCSCVLRTVAPHVTLLGDTDALDSYRPRPLQVQIYLDSPSPDAVTARVLYVYGEDTVEPYADPPAPEAPWRDPVGEHRAQAVIQREFTALQPATGLLVLRGDDDRLYDFVSRGVAALRTVATVYASDSFDRLTVAPAPRLTVGVSLVSDLLELEVDAPSLTGEELAGIITGYRERKPYHRLQNGRFIRLDDEALAGLCELADSLSLTEAEWRAGRISLPKYRALYLEQILRQREGVYIRRDALFRGLTERCRAATENAYPVPDSLRPVLRPYQKSGYRWLRTMEELGFGGILADDMGLGKTVQVIALLLAAKEEGRCTHPSLVVCPTSLCTGWEREIARFAPSLRTLCVTGDAATRAALLEQAEGYDLLITSYDMLKRDVALYTAMTFHYHILDEAQYIKNSHTQNAKAAKAVHSAQRFALTGTPVENRLSELWSIFDFLMPGLLFTYPRFRDRFELPAVRQGDTRALERLGRLCSPFILRRLKRQVLTELPPKTEQVLPATMEEPQRLVYAATLGDLRRRLESHRGALTGESRMNVLAALTRLRQICCDPRLCCEGYTGQSAKLETCLELLRQAADGGHKVLLFSQFTSMLELIRQRLEQEGISYYLLQGSTPAPQRAALVDAFNTDATAVFLISLKAGGTGLNLVGADMVIHYDPWWNRSVQNQATDRAHRIGQKNPVQVVRLVTRDTVEEKILRLQEDKWQLANAVVGENGPDIAALSAEELLALLQE
ncbi:MAG: hypothetical protein E7541_04730 [Ruminococcaceae bacterium]|nr:hypothetical protein [Oscillospiraceae bacterium]